MSIDIKTFKDISVTEDKIEIKHNTANNYVSVARTEHSGKVWVDIVELPTLIIALQQMADALRDKSDE